jgi:hypothetical protein
MLNQEVKEKLSDENLSSIYSDDKRILVDKCDNFFQDIGLLFHDLNKPMFTSNCWVEIIMFCKKWQEKNDKKLHLGTPFYWLSISYFLMHDFDKATVCIYDAFLEDKINNHTDPQMPASGFLSFKNDPNFNDYGLIEELREFVNRRLEIFSSNNPTFNWQKFEVNFLSKQTKKYLGLKILFFNSITKIWGLRRLHNSRINIKNPAANLIFANALLGIMISAESIFKCRLRSFYFKNLGSIYRHYESINRNWIRVPNDMDICWNNFQRMVNNPSKSFIINRRKISYDNNFNQFSFIFTWKYRNFVAHDPSQNIFSWDQNFTTVFQLILNTFFLSLA